MSRPIRYDPYATQLWVLEFSRTHGLNEGSRTYADERGALNARRVCKHWSDYYNRQAWDQVQNLPYTRSPYFPRNRGRRIIVSRSGCTVTLRSVPFEGEEHATA